MLDKFRFMSSLSLKVMVYKPEYERNMEITIFPHGRIKLLVVFSKKNIIGSAVSPFKSSYLVKIGEMYQIENLVDNFN